jgi:hypothetical protein
VKFETKIDLKHSYILCIKYCFIFKFTNTVVVRILEHIYKFHIKMN